MAKTELKVSEDASLSDKRATPRITNIVLNSEADFKYRHVMACAPERFGPSDLQNPEAWDGSKLLLHDHVYVVAPNGSWSADGVIIWTNNKDAVFNLIKQHWFNKQRDPLFQDENFRVQARAGVFDVIRKVDGQPVEQGLHTEALAIQAIRNQYPKKVA